MLETDQSINQSIYLSTYHAEDLAVYVLCWGSMYLLIYQAGE